MLLMAIPSYMVNEITWDYPCCEVLSWYGNKDQKWWDHVPEHNRDNGYDIRECPECCKRYKLNYKTNEVVEVVNGVPYRWLLV